MIDALFAALEQLTSWSALLVLLGGTLIGTLAAVLPGFGGVTAMAILLPLTFTMDVPHAMMFLVTIMAAGGFAGSVTSILLNLPGEGVNAATLLDGYPMARQGKAGVALGASATASGLGALFGLLVLGVSLPILREVLLFFGPAELFAFTMAGVALIATVSRGSLLKGMIAGGLGLLLGAVGLNLVVGGSRYTFGMVRLADGIPLIPAIVGLFALPELYVLMRQNTSISQSGEVVAHGTFEGVREVLRRPVLLIRSSLIGTGVGILPGVGGSVASWVSYFAAVNTSKDPESFGHGNIEGVIAPEAANDAKEGGSMMPLLALGIPGSLSTAILLSAFLIHGINPGRRMFEQDLDLVWVMLLGMVVANVLTSVIGLAAARSLVKFTLIPVRVMAPFILLLAVLGPYLAGRSYYAIMMAFVFAGIGLAMRTLGYPRPPFLVGLVLFPIAETNFHVAYQINRQSFDFLLQPLTLSVLLLTLVLVFLPHIRRAWTRSRDRDTTGGASVSEDLLDEAGQGPSDLPPDPRWDVFAQMVVLAVVGLLFVESFEYRPLARLFPLVVICATGSFLLGQLVRTVRVLRSDGQYRRLSVTAGLAGGSPRSAGVVTAWIGSFLLALWSFGFVAGSAVAVLLFQILFDPARVSPRRLGTAALSGLAAIGFLMFVVEGAMGVRLPSGFWS